MKRFRGSIYVDVFVEETGSEAEERVNARQKLRSFANEVPNAEVGDVAEITGNLLEDQVRLEMI